MAHDGGLSVLFGTAGGSFTTPRAIRTETDVSLLAAADFDGDGHLDLALASRYAPGVRVRRGDGSGTFAPGELLRTESPPTALLAGSFDAAPGADLLVGTPESVRIFQGSSTGLQPGQRLRVPGRPAALGGADLDGNGRREIIVPISPGRQAFLFTRLGGAPFVERGTVAAGTNPQAVFAGKVGPGGDSGLVFLDDLGVTLARRENHGGFIPAERILRNDAARALAASDLDGDGTAEIMVADGVRSALLLLRSDPEGGWDSTQAYEVGRDPIGIVADRTKAGPADVITLNRLGNSVTLLRAVGDRRLAAPPILDAGTDPVDATSADFDGDGHADIAAADDATGGIHVLLGNGDGGFSRRATIRVGARPRALLAAHLDADRHLDLAVANFATATVTVLAGDGTGNFAAPLSVAVGLGPTALASGDFDSDGNVDIAAANSLSDSVSILYGDGHGRFPRTDNFPVVPHPSFLVFGALKGGGDSALIVGNERGRTVSVLRSGPEGLKEPLEDTVGHRVRPLIADDFDNDGWIDLIAPGSGDDEISVLPGTGPNEFAPPLRFPVGRAARALAAADFDEDGRVDLLVLSEGTRSLVLLRNTSGSGGVTGAPAPLPLPDRGRAIDPWRVPGAVW